MPRSLTPPSSIALMRSPRSPRFWKLDPTLEMPFVIEACQRALWVAKPMIWKSDQGSHCISPQYLHFLQEAQVKISIDSKGRALDNISTERLWRTVKYEEVFPDSTE